MLEPLNEEQPSFVAIWWHCSIVETVQGRANDWVKVLHPTICRHQLQNRSFQRCSSQPISWLVLRKYKAENYNGTLMCSGMWCYMCYAKHKIVTLKIGILELLMVDLCNRADHYIFALWFLSFFFFSPNLSSRRLDVYHTSTHGVALVRI